MGVATAEFWYDFASTYSYPAAMRIEALAATRGVDLVWRPFLLGPIFAAQGWRDSPFNLYPVKGQYMWRDMARLCTALQLPLRRPEPFPQNSLLAARVAVALDDDVRPAFTRAVYRAEFGEGRAIAERAEVAALIASLGLSAEATFARATSEANKDKLKRQCAEAQGLGLPGAPCIVTDDREVFWGNDRLEQALDWAAGVRS
jgi:2-hydroxychromene-2-carboxylate isomerase